MTKSTQIAERIAATFVEAAVSYITVNQTSLSGTVKLLTIGAMGAGLSAVYNLLRQSNPTIPSPSTALQNVVMNGVPQLTTLVTSSPTSTLAPAPGTAVAPSPPSSDSNSDTPPALGETQKAGEPIATPGSEQPPTQTSM